MRSIFVVVSLALFVAAAVGLALAWDGSYTLFVLLDTRAPYASYGRLTDLVLRMPVVLASQFTTHPVLLQTIFALPYAALPLLALLASWWIVRDRARPLFVWAALVIGLATLPGQACFVCQANAVVQLFVPILLALVLGMPVVTIPVVALLALVIFFFHPSAVLVFALAAAAAFVLGWRRRDRRKMLWGAAVVFLLLALVEEARFLLAQNSYELEQLSPLVLLTHMREGLIGLPLLAVVCAWLSALLLALEPLPWRERVFSGARVWRNARALATGGTALSGLALLFWAANPRSWGQALAFRQWALFCALPFLLLILFEGMMHGRTNWEGLYSQWPHRLRVSQISAFAFGAVLLTQSLVWQNLTGRLSAALSASPGPCVSAGELDWLQQTPLDDWAITALSVVDQGRSAQRVMMPANGCATENFGDGLPIAIFSPANWQFRDWQNGWFDLSTMGSTLVAQQQTAPGCRYPLTAGWYGVEKSGTDWWRWTSGRAELRLVLAQAERATLSGEIISVRVPNGVSVAVDGNAPQRFSVVKRGFNAMPPLGLALHRGKNTITLSSDNGPVLVPGDDRPLAIGFRNLHLRVDGGANLCS